MLRMRVCATHMDGLLVQNSPNKGSLFGKFSLNKGRLVLNRLKMGSFRTKSSSRRENDGKLWQLLEGRGKLLKTGRQTLVHSQVIIWPPNAKKLRFEVDQNC